jgi:hypothetical protein
MSVQGIKEFPAKMFDFESEKLRPGPASLVDIDVQVQVQALLHEVISRGITSNIRYRGDSF